LIGKAGNALGSNPVDMFIPHDALSRGPFHIVRAGASPGEFDGIDTQLTTSQMKDSFYEL